MIALAVNYVMFVWHAHQPVLNQGDIEVCYSRLPLILEHHPKQKFVINLQGSLISQLKAWSDQTIHSYDPNDGYGSGFDIKVSDVLQKYKNLLSSGQLELLASPFYHPIVPLSMDDGSYGLDNGGSSPSGLGYRTAKLQIMRTIDLIREVFDYEPYGIWLPENAWSMKIIPVLNENYGMSHKLCYSALEEVSEAIEASVTSGGENVNLVKPTRVSDATYGTWCVFPRDRTSSVDYMSFASASDPVDRANALYDRLKRVVDAYRDQGYSDGSFVIVISSDAEFIGIHWWPGEDMIEHLLWAFDNDDADSYNFETVTMKEWYDWFNHGADFRQVSWINDSSWGPNQYSGPYNTPFDEWDGNYFDRQIRDRLHDARQDVITQTIDALGLGDRVKYNIPKLEVAVKCLLNAEQSDWRYYYNEGGSAERGYNYHLAIAAECLAEQVRQEKLGSEPDFKIYEMKTCAYSGPDDSNKYVVMENKYMKLFFCPIHEGKLVEFDSKLSWHNLSQTWYTEDNKLYHSLADYIMKETWAQPWMVARSYNYTYSQNGDTLQLTMDYTCSSASGDPSEIDGLKIEKTITLGKNDDFFTVTYTLTNTSASDMSFAFMNHYGFTPGGHVDDYMRCRYDYSINGKITLGTWSTAYDTDSSSEANIRYIDLNEETGEKMEWILVENQSYHIKFSNAEMWKWWDEIGWEEPREWIKLEFVSSSVPLDYIEKGQRYQSWSVKCSYAEKTLPAGSSWTIVQRVKIGTGIYPEIDPSKWVKIEPSNPVAGDTITITYAPTTGPLYGSNRVYLHWGINGWQQVQDSEMTEIGDNQWQIKIETERTWKSVEFVFKNDENEWDNNEGRNWQINLLSGLTENSVSMHPYNNPVCTGEFSLWVKFDAPAQEVFVEVYSLDGRKVTSAKWTDLYGESTLTVSLSGLKRGLYIYKFTAKSGDSKIIRRGKFLYLPKSD